jgi:predicted RNase H-like nuclease
MEYSEKKVQGRADREQALRRHLKGFDAIIKGGREKRLPLEDILDAAVACWSALRLAGDKGRSLIEPVPHDASGLPMTIWV